MFRGRKELDTHELGGTVRSGPPGTDRATRPTASSVAHAPKESWRDIFMCSLAKTGLRVKKLTNYGLVCMKSC